MYGLVPDSQDDGDAAGHHQLHLLGSGEPGLQLTAFPDDIIELTEYTATGTPTFYTCKTQVGETQINQLFLRYSGETAFADCVDVELLPQCVVAAAEPANGVISQCYSDVQDIDWTKYFGA